MQKLLMLGLLGIATLLGTSVVSAQSPVSPTSSDPRLQFRNVSQIEFPAVTTPAVVRLDVPNILNSNLSYVYERETGLWPGKVLHTEIMEQQIIANCVYGQSQIPVGELTPTEMGGDCTSLIDDNQSTHLDVQALPAEPNWYSVFVLNTGGAELVNGVQLVFDEYSSKEATVSVSASVMGIGLKELVITRALSANGTLTFPSTPVGSLQIKMFHSQPLRIKEIKVMTVGGATTANTIFFLAQPGRTYELYANPEGTPAVRTQEPASVDFMPKVNAKLVGLQLNDGSFTGANQLYQPADTDADGIVNLEDNCPDISNPDQEDVNQNGVGDVCDDFDADGVLNSTDNCSDVPNRTQLDTDGDGIGDECDLEESRLTEKYTWIPWMAFAFAGVVLLGMMGYLFTRKPSVALEENKPVDQLAQPKAAPKSTDKV